MRIALGNLRHHATGHIASFIALFLGATVVIGCAGLLETGIRNAAPPQRLAAAPIVVAGDQRYHGTEQELVYPERVRPDAGTAGIVAAVPGVADVVTDVSVAAVLHGGTDVTAHGWSSARLTPYRIAEGEPPSGPDGIVLGEQLAREAGLRPGDRAGLRVNGTPRDYIVSGVASGTGDGGTVFLADAEADRLTGLLPGRAGTFDVAGVFPEPGADIDRVARDVRAAVAEHPVADRPLTVLTGDGRGRAEDPSVIADGGDLVPLAAAFGGLSAMVAVFVVSGTLGLALRQRQRETALLRAIGATPGRIRRMIAGETLVLAVLATALARYPGERFGRWLLGEFADAGVVPDAIAYRAGSLPPVLGSATVLLTALAAALVAASGAARTRPAEALAEASVERRPFSRIRLVTGVLCLAGGALLARGTAGSDGPDAAGVATPAVMVWAAAVGLLGPPLVRTAMALLRGPARRVAGLAGELAVENTRTRLSRVASAVTPIMLATGLALSLVLIHSSEEEGARRASEEQVRADLVVSPGAGGLPSDLVETIGERTDVAAATARLTSTGFLEPATDPAAAPPADEEEAGPQPTELPLWGVTPDGLDRTTSFTAAEGSLADLDGDTIALPTRYAAGLRIGDTVPVRLGDGARVRLTLAATIEARPGYETALVPVSLLLPHTDAGAVREILVRTAAGTDRSDVAAAIEATAGVRADGRETLAAERDGTQTTMANLVLGVVVGYAAIALVNAQVLATAERRRELALLRLVGAGRRQVLRMMTVESTLVAVAGIGLGALVAGATLVPVALSLLDSVLPAGPAWLPAVVAASALLLTAAPTLLASGAALRHRPGAVVATRE
ncbi:ABC transporter permease [Streptomyces sp. RFCAC02]|uniref:ABC transporter permease n=1 Tax=Streptomyces sp. RFCAC02 TaxID=2499143 RepID=UPI001021B563|nr:ABC transporter permease [Streptomyces sp. RFCAC02]